ncbi:MAG: Fe-S cluster assembly ATPase SufC [Sulfobacillus sp.]
MRPSLEIRDLHVSIDDKEILSGVNLTIQGGEVHAIMGPNGTGKSTLASTMMGHPRYQVTQGEILIDGENIVGMKPDERARRGLFLAMQYPQELSGVTTGNFLRTAVNSLHPEHPMPVLQFHKLLTEKMKLLDIEPNFAQRYLNEGFSGGEKKRNEILQMAVLAPRLAVLDEIDSGLDIDAVKIVANGVNTLLGENMGVMIITHYERILRYVRPHFVHILLGGKVAVSGGPELADELEARGYDWIKTEADPALAE